MKYQNFRDFDAFATSVRDVDCTMMRQNPKHSSWKITHANLPEIHVQMGKLGSGNIVEGQSNSNGYLSNPQVPAHIREDLNVESGLNDGICVPILFALLAFATHQNAEGSTSQLRHIARGCRQTAD